MFKQDAISGVVRTGAAASRAESKPSRLEEDVVGLFDQLQDRLLRYLSSLGLPPADGEEVIQEVFLALFRHLQQGKPRHNLRAWVFQVAHNLALKRRLQTKRNRETYLQFEGRAAAEGFVVDREPNPEDRLCQQERQVRLARVWDALPELDRRCLSLRAEGLTYRDIAQVLEISLGSVSISLARSLARFARADGR